MMVVLWQILNIPNNLKNYRNIHVCLQVWIESLYKLKHACAIYASLLESFEIRWTGAEKNMNQQIDYIMIHLYLIYVKQHINLYFIYCYILFFSYYYSEKRGFLSQNIFFVPTWNISLHFLKRTKIAYNAQKDYLLSRIFLESVNPDRRAKMPRFNAFLMPFDAFLKGFGNISPPPDRKIFLSQKI